MLVRFLVSAPLQLRITSAETSHRFGTLFVLPLHCIPFACFYAYKNDDHGVHLFRWPGMLNCFAYCQGTAM